MSEYKHTVAKPQTGGFSESPEQGVGNSTSPVLNDNNKNLLNKGVAVVYGKKVVSSVYQGVSGQLGSARLEEATEAFTSLSTYAILAGVSGGFVLPLLALGADVVKRGVENMVETHAMNLENDRIRATAGVRVTYNGGGYY